MTTRRVSRKIRDSDIKQPISVSQPKTASPFMVRLISGFTVDLLQRVIRFCQHISSFKLRFNTTVHVTLLSLHFIVAFLPCQM